MPEEQDGGPVKRGRDSEPSRLGFQACHGLFQVEQVDSLLSFSFSIRNVGVIAAAWKEEIHCFLEPAHSSAPVVQKQLHSQQLSHHRAALPGHSHQEGH